MILSHIYINLVMRSSLSKVVFSTVESWIVQYSTVQYSTVQYSAVQCSTVQYSAVQYSTVQYSTVQYSTVQCSAVQCSAVQCSRIDVVFITCPWISSWHLCSFCSPSASIATHAAWTPSHCSNPTHHHHHRYDSFF